MKIVLTGIPPYDGEYPIDLARLTNRDLHDVKRMSGARALEIEDALEHGDTDVIVAIAYIAVRKSGLHPRLVEDALWDATLDRITLDLTDEEEAADADPPPPSVTGTHSTRSGSASNADSEPSPESPHPSTGQPGSEPSASVRMISGS